MKRKPSKSEESAPTDLQAGRNRAFQLVKGRGGGGSGKRFGEAKQKVFLECFAGTCNAKWSAKVAGVAYSTVYRHRMHNPVFAHGWDRALEQGYARMEMRTVQQQFADVGDELDALELNGDWDLPDPPVMDLDRAIQLLKHHHDRVMKIREKRDRAMEAAGPLRSAKPAGPMLELADDDAVIEALSGRLASFGAEIRREALRLAPGAPEDGPGD